MSARREPDGSTRQFKAGPSIDDRLHAERQASSRLISGLAHDARTPLGSISMMADLLAEDSRGNLDSKQVGYATKIRQAAGEVRDLLESVNLLAKLTSGRLEPAPTATTLRALVERVTGDSSAIPEIHFDKGLPERVNLDAERFALALVALLDAAHQASPDAVTLRLRVTGDELVCQVSDQGGAIAEEDRRHLFEPFANLGHRWRGRGGERLQLALAHALAVWAGGRLELKDNSPRDATFELRWPVGDR